MGAKRTLSKVFSRKRRADIIAKSTGLLSPPPHSPVTSLPGEINIYCVSPGHSAVSLVTYDDTVHQMEAAGKSARQQPPQTQNSNVVGGGQFRISSAGGNNKMIVQQKVKMPVSKELAPLLPDLSIEDEEPLFIPLLSSSNKDADADSFVKPRVIASFPMRDFPASSPPASGITLRRALAFKPGCSEDRNVSKRRGRATATNMLTRTQLFDRICDDVFDELDASGSGSVEKKNLYDGLLLVHLQLFFYVGPIACKPVPRSQVENHLCSRYNECNHIYRDQFKESMMMLTSSLFGRIIVQWAIILMFVPFPARYIADRVFFFASFMLSPWLKQRNEPFYFRTEAVRRFDEDLSSQCGHYLAHIWHQIQMIPDSTWRAILLTAVTCSLGLILVPWCLYYAESQASIWIGSSRVIKKKK